MLMNLSCLHQYGFIEYNLCLSWIQWLTIHWKDKELGRRLQSKLMAKRNSRFRVLKIVRGIEISYSILYDGPGTIL